MHPILPESALPPLPNEFEIDVCAGGELLQPCSASNGRVGMTVYPDGDAKLFKRNAIKRAGSPKAEKVQWLVGELNGVRAYVQDKDGVVNIVITTQDLRP